MRWTTDCKGPCGLPPARASGARGRRRARGRGRRRPRHLHQLAVGLALDQAVHVAVGRIVPDALRLQLQRVRVPALAPVVRRVARAVAPAAHVPADEADPQVLARGAGRGCGAAGRGARAHPQAKRPGARLGGAAGRAVRRARLRVHAVAADRAAGVAPALQALAVEAVVAHLPPRAPRSRRASRPGRQLGRGRARRPRTVVTTPLMCSSRRSRQTGQVGSSVWPAGGSGAPAPLLSTRTSFTKSRRQTTSGSSEENWAPRARSARRSARSPPGQGWGRAPRVRTGLLLKSA